MPGPIAVSAARPALTLKRRFNAPPARVFEAWTDPKKLVCWFGPAETRSGTVRAEMDVRVGGRFRASFTTEDGEYHEVSGVYREVVTHERLSFTWGWYTMPERESLVTVTLRPDGDGTLLTLHHERFFDEAARDGHNRGWSGTLDKLEHFLA
ncbi:MAG: SRPBCC domain-containing protein [Xanthobacteraceae bacterium]|nr:SRPBCC domain-containing protein [Xanthobacteraceae bacterium]